MTEQHPITPPVDLIRKWNEEAATAPMADQRYIATQAARWGADAELEACCEWLKAKEWIHPEFSDELRDARRPKPPSLKEQALAIVTRANRVITDEEQNTIRLALEQLND